MLTLLAREPARLAPLGATALPSAVAVLAPLIGTSRRLLHRGAHVRMLSSTVVESSLPEDTNAAARLLQAIAQSATQLHARSSPSPTATRHFVDGASVEAISGRMYSTIDPSTGEPICAVAEASGADVDRAVRAAHRAFAHGPWPHMCPSERGHILRRFADELEAHADELAQLEALDSGILLSCARTADVPLSVELLRSFAGASWMSGALSPAGVALPTPVGVVATIAPWWRPLVFGIWEVAPALAAGNTVVHHPARQTPLSMLRVAELASEAGVPPGVLNVLSGPNPVVSASLGTHKLVDRLSCAALSARSAAIVCEDADVAQAAEQTCRAAFGVDDRICAAGSVVFVHEAVHDEFVSLAAERAAHTVVGSQFDASSEQGPLTSDTQLRAAQRHVRTGVVEGARLLAGGQRVGDVGFYMRPAVLAGVRPEMRVSSSAACGPVLSVIKVGSDAEASAYVAAGEYTLAAFVWTRSAARASAINRMLRATGAVWVKPSAELPLGCDIKTGRGAAALAQFTHQCRSSSSAATTTALTSPFL